MRIVFISDTHNQHDYLTIPDGDILIHCGDATLTGTIQEISSFANWFSLLPHKHKVFVAGNHDWLFEKNLSLARSILGADTIYLQDSETTINGLRIYGSPWQPTFFNWAFNLDRGERIKRMWDCIPRGLDILITHGPPQGILDSTGEYHAGCEMLSEALERIKPRIHAFGHIHEAYGMVEANGTRFINGCVLDGDYQLVNEPIAIEVVNNYSRDILSSLDM